MKKFLVALVILGAVGVGSWQIYRRVTALGRQTRRRPANVPVVIEVVPVRKTTIRDIGVFTGSLLPKSQFLVAPKITGRLEKLLVNLGDRVRRGQLIAKLDDEEFAQQAEQARAELKVANANVESCTSDLEVARREFERVKALWDKKIASESERDAAEAQHKTCQAKKKVAEAQVTQKDAALKAALVRLSYTRIHAWWEADDSEPRVIGERFVDEGALLRANEPIVSVLEDRLLTGVVHVIERDYPKVKLGQEATVTTDAYPRKAFTGQVVRIAPLLRESSRQARVEVEIANADRLLRPGMFIRARVEFGRHEGATVIPTSALVKRNDKQGIFLADLQTHKARFVPLTLGVVNGELAEVTEPPLAGQVVTLGQHLLENGSTIRLPGERPPGQAPKKGGVKPGSRPASSRPGGAQ